MILRKSTEDLAAMARAGRVVAAMHEAVRDAVRPGATTADLDAVARDVLADAGARASFLGYHGFPAVVCTSVNDRVVHGIPRADEVLEEGDLVSVDAGAVVDGFHADSAVTWVVGGDAAARPGDRELVDTTREAMWAGMRECRADRRLGDVGAAIEAVAAPHGFGVVREYVGHGIGRALHEDPSVPNYGRPGRGLRLAPGWALAVEPMFTAGAPANRKLDDGWTVVTRDGGRAAHWEHTLAVTADGPVVLTARDDDAPWVAADGRLRGAADAA